MKYDTFRPSIVYHPPAEMLPPGFQFPKAYLDYVNQKEIVELYPWYFLCHVNDTTHFDGWVNILKEQYPNRKLVPFAKYEETDDLDCFEPADDREVSAVHLYPLLYRSRL